MVKSIDQFNFNRTERTILEKALSKPQMTNSEIATAANTTVPIVRDVRDAYENRVELPASHTAGSTEVYSGDSTSGNTAVYDDGNQSKTESERSNSNPNHPSPNYCPYCGTDLSSYPESKFCLHCGKEL